MLTKSPPHNSKPRIFLEVSTAGHKPEVAAIVLLHVCLKQSQAPLSRLKLDCIHVLSIKKKPHTILLANIIHVFAINIGRKLKGELKLTKNVSVALFNAYYYILCLSLQKGGKVTPTPPPSFPTPIHILYTNHFNHCIENFTD